MKKQNKLSLDEEINKEAEQILKDVENAEELKDLKVSERMERSLFEQIQEYEYEKKHKVVRRGKKKKIFVLALASVLILVFGSVMTSVGSKSYWKVMKEKGTDDGNTQIINVDNMDSKESKDLDEVGVYREIYEKLGLSIVRWGYLPKRMILQRYEVDEQQREACLFYRYEGQLIRCTMYTNDEDSSFGEKKVDTLLNSYEINNEGHSIKVEEYQIDQSEQRRYVAAFEYGGVHYQIKGTISKEELDKILKNILFVKKA